MNRPAEADGSLYQVCATLKARLERVPGLQRYFDASASEEMFERRGSAAYVPTIGAVPPGKQADPVTQLWRFFRLGSSLCALFNALGPNTPLDADIVDDAKACKRDVYHFVQACKAELGYSDEELFTISNVFSDNTSDLLKVIHTVQLLVDALEKRGLLMAAPPRSASTSGASSASVPAAILEQPKDQRDKVVEELLTTERKYVQDLEVLGRYYSELQALNILSADTVHQMLPNLLQLIDFQRRFLVGVEYHATLPAAEQRFGLLFCNMQSRFDVYEGYALNQKIATDIAQAEAAKLHVLDHILESKYELHGMLIKPVQRICKYPLLLRELVRHTPANWPYYHETVEGLETMKHITNRVNETQRRVENIAIVKELTEQLRDWRGHNLADFGELLHDGVFPVIKVGLEREYHLYLFENIILCCKEAVPSKKSSMGLKRQKNKRVSLVLKGRIYMAYITKLSVSKDEGYLLHISWGKDDASDVGFFDIRFRNEEQLTQWESTIRRMVARYQEVTSDIFGPPSASAPLATPGSAIGHTGYDDATDDDTIAGDDPAFRSSSGASTGQGGYFYDTSTQGSPTNTDTLSTMSARTLSTSSASHYGPTQLSDDLTQLKMTSSSVSLSSAQHQQQQQQRNRSASTPNYSLHTMAQAIPPMPGQPQTAYSGHGHGHGHGHAHHGYKPGSVGAAPSGAHPSPAIRYKSESAVSTLGSYGRGVREQSISSQDSASSAGSKGSQTLGTSTSSVGTAAATTAPIPATPAPGAAPAAAPFGGVANSSTAPVKPASAATSAPTSAPASTPASTAAPAPAKVTNLKVKLHYLEDTFLVVVPSDIMYSSLLERVERKIRLCGKQTPNPLRIKYKDEDNDFVTINSEEDIQMALDLLQQQDVSANDDPKSANDLLSIWVA